jgi:hypothetical protein
MTCNQEKISVVIFSYNRPRHLTHLYTALSQLEVSARYCFHFFHDGPKTDTTQEIHASIAATESFVPLLRNYEIKINATNLGLARSIKNGLNSVFSVHQKAIILEDDIIPKAHFFDVMDYFLDSEVNNALIGSVTGANTTKFPFFTRSDFLLSGRHSSWGWGTWANRWNAIDWDCAESNFLNDKNLLKKVRRVSPDLVRYAQLQKENKIDSWATFMNIDFIRRNLLCIVPKYNIIENIGFDGSGTHSSNARSKQVTREFFRDHNPEFPKKGSLRKSKVYNLLVFKDKSLLRDFPKGTLIRAALRVKRLLTL